MNDFLKNLRGSTKEKRSGPVRGNMDRRVDVERRMTQPSKRPTQQDTRMDELEKRIAGIERMLKEVQGSLVPFFAKNFERHALMEERKMILLESLLPYLENFLGKTSGKEERLEKTPASIRKAFEQAPTAAPERSGVRKKRGNATSGRGGSPSKIVANGKKMSEKQRNEIMDKIYTLRREGKSFEQITRILLAENVPTLSNRGQWHAQTVHRLCRGMD